jgi:hypothetical protein
VLETSSAAGAIRREFAGNAGNSAACNRGIPANGWIGAMRTDRGLATGLLLGIAIAWIVAVATAPSATAAKRHGPAAAKLKNASAAKGAATRTAGGPHRPTFRAPRAAAQEAARLGAAVGNGCNGKADIQRDDHQWVVLCSNGKAYVVEMAAGPHPSAPATECSLAGTGPGPACFSP